MVSQRELVFLGAGLALGLSLAAIAAGIGSGGSAIPPGVDGTHVQIDGTVRSVDVANDRLYVNASGGGLTPLGIDGATPFACDTGGNLVSCAARRSWAWIEPGSPVCVTATLRVDDAPKVREAFVDANCSTALS